jgi:hypothetical protein
MRARLGSGGSPIEIKGVNGQVRFESDAPANTTSAAPGVNTSSAAPSGPAAPAPPHGN